MNDTNVRASQRFLELNDTCELGSMPRLSSYCLETRLYLFYDDIYLPASNFYADTVIDQSIPRWLETSNITTDNAQSIENMLGSESCIDWTTYVGKIWSLYTTQWLALLFVLYIPYPAYKKGDKYFDNHNNNHEVELCIITTLIYFFTKRRYI